MPNYLEIKCNFFENSSKCQSWVNNELKTNITRFVEDPRVLAVIALIILNCTNLGFVASDDSQIRFSKTSAWQTNSVGVEKNFGQNFKNNGQNSENNGHYFFCLCRMRGAEALVWEDKENTNRR